MKWITGGLPLSQLGKPIPPPLLMPHLPLLLNRSFKLLHLGSFSVTQFYLYFLRVVSKKGEGFILLSSSRANLSSSEACVLKRRTLIKEFSVRVPNDVGRNGS
eukprot:TRINITY_DN42149_c0_g1_i1.p1 TRINITY_DN42149_c0_g1~~TRINITY_DN42149_c0_g1_i1.p1  ORF type:complete len:103 (-),score=8.83 TRINITY_DN42149_c0_g1_i1:1429-1737(-)